MSAQFPELFLRFSETRVFLRHSIWSFYVNKLPCQRAEAVQHHLRFRCAGGGSRLVGLLSHATQSTTEVTRFLKSSGQQQTAAVAEHPESKVKVSLVTVSHREAASEVH